MPQDSIAFPLERYAGKYKVFYEESYKCEEPGRQGIEKPWSAELRGEHGTIYPHSETQMAVFTDGTGIRQTLKRKLHLEVAQWGHKEATFVFGPERFEEVAAVLQLKKRRIMSDKQKAHLEKLKAIGAGYHFGTGKKGPETGQI